MNHYCHESLKRKLCYLENANHAAAVSLQSAIKGNVAALIFET